MSVTRWKTQRSKSRCERNDAASIAEATGAALSTPHERLRIKALLRLHGVELRTASVLLHFAHRDPYPILDFRALWSLGQDEAPNYWSFELWDEYTRKCRSLATAAGVSMRVLDRALWQYSKERHRPNVGHSAQRRATDLRVPTGGRPNLSKSERMRELFAQGWTVTQVAAALDVAYGFAYGVRQRWRAKGGGR